MVSPGAVVSKPKMWWSAPVVVITVVITVVSS